MKAAELLESLERQGFALTREGNELKVGPKNRITPELRQEIAENKMALLELLSPPTPRVVADEIERLVHLGQRLRLGEIKAICCGITGRRCTACQGVPCYGSQPWEETRDRTT